MPADSDASHAVKGSVKQGEGESDNYVDDEASKRLPNELLDKIINFALNVRRCTKHPCRRYKMSYDL